MGGYARVTQDFMAAVLRGGVPEQVSGSVQLIPDVPYGTFWRVDSGADIYTVLASPINCDIVNGKLSKNGKPYVDIFADDLGSNWSAIYTNVIMDGRPRHIYPVNFTVKPGEYTDLNRVGEVVPEPVWITLGTGFEARDQLRAALTARGLTYQTVTEIPFEIELVGTGSVEQLFQDCSVLTTIPEMDMSQVTYMKDMFSQCVELAHVPDMDTSQVTNTRGVFYMCKKLTNAPALDTSQVVDSAYMFYGCNALVHVPDMDTSQNMDFYSMFRYCWSLTDGNVRLIGRTGGNTIRMIEESGLTREPFYDTAGNPI